MTDEYVYENPQVLPEPGEIPAFITDTETGEKALIGWATIDGENATLVLPDGGPFLKAIQDGTLTGISFGDPTPPTGG